MPKPESKIQREILDYLKKQGYFCWRQNNIPVYDRNLHTYRAATTIKGIPDIICIQKGTGKFIGIEVKTTKGKMSPDQVMFQKRLESEGGIYILATCKEDVDNFLTVKK